MVYGRYRGERVYNNTHRRPRSRPRPRRLPIHRTRSCVMRIGIILNTVYRTSSSSSSSHASSSDDGAHAQCSGFVPPAAAASSVAPNWIVCTGAPRGGRTHDRIKKKKLGSRYFTYILYSCMSCDIV